MVLDRLTKIDGGGISTTSDYRVGVITASKFVGPFDGTGGNFSGVVTATNGVFSGNVTIGGTLTYEDVTNIDSVGLITARNGISVPDAKSIFLGNSNDLSLKHDGTNSTIYNNTGDLNIQGDVIRLKKSDASKTMASFIAGGQAEFNYDTTRRLYTTPTGAQVVGTVVADGADINGDLDVDGHTNLDNVSIVGVTTMQGTLLNITSGSASSPFIKLGTNVNTCEIEGRVSGGENHLVLSSNNSTDHLKITGSAVQLPNDNQRLEIGANQELKIAQDGTHNITYMQNVGPLQLQTDDLRLYNYSTQDLYLRALTNAGVSLYYDYSNHSTAKLSTTATGVTIDGTAVAGGLDISGDVDVTGDINVTSTLPVINLIDSNNNDDFAIKNVNGVFTIRDATNGADRLTINSSGKGTFTTELDITGDLTVESSLPQIFLNDTNNNDDFAIRNNDGVFTVRDSTNGADRLTIDSTGNFVVPNNNVGIKSTAPRGRLDIQFDGAPSFITFGADADNPKVEFFRSTGGSPSHYATEFQEVLGDFVISTAAAANLGSHSYVEKVRIKNNGRFGIGTADPDGVLHISSGTANSDCVLIIESDTDDNDESSNPQIWFKQDGDKNVGFVGQNSNTLVISNNVSSAGGISFRTGTTNNTGTTDPLTSATEKLLISSVGELTSTAAQANVATFTSNQTASTIYVKDTDGDGIFISGSSAYGHRIYTNTTEDLLLGTNSTEKVRIKNNGRVGIGTNNPQHQFDLYDIQASSSGTAPVLNIRNGYAGIPNQSNALKSEIRISHRNHNSAHDFMATRIIVDTGDNYMQRTHLRFLVANANNGTERLTINPYGNIGINTNNPYSPLEIQGDAGVNDARITFTRHGNPPNDAIIGHNFYRIGTDSVAGFGAYRESAMDDAYFKFHTQNTGGSFAERLRITSTGAVTISGNRNQIAPTTYDDITGTNQAGLLIGSSGLTDAGIVLRTGTSGTGRIYFGDNSGSDAGRKSGQVSYYHNGDFMIFATADTERVRIDSSGKSVFKKDAGSTNNTYSIVAELNAKTSGSTSANFGPALYLSHTFGGTNYAGSLITSQTDADVNTTHISFYPRNYGWTEALRITSAGHTIPGGNGSNDLGANTSNRWRNIYGQTLSLTSYAVLGSLVVNDPGSSYYSFNNRIGGNTIIKGTTVCTDDIHSTAPSTFPASDVQLMVYTSTTGQPITNTNCARLLIATDAKQVGVQGYNGALDFGNSDASASGGSGEFNWRLASIMSEAGGDTSSSIGDGDLQFWTKASSGSLSRRATITSAGRFGINETSPSGIFHVRGAGNSDADGMFFRSGSGGTGAKFIFMTNDNSDRSKYIQHSAYWTEIGCHNNEGVRFRESDGDIRFYMNGSSGNYNFTGSNISDRNLKENIETITTNSIDLIKQVIPRTFNWKFDRKNIPHGGFIAQEMQPLFPKLINGVEYDESRTDDGDPNEPDAGKCNPTGMGFDYNGYTAYLTKAMQELIAKVETLEAEVASLKGS